MASALIVAFALTIAYILEVCRAAETFRTAKSGLLRCETLSCGDTSEAAARQIREAQQKVEEARLVLRDFCRTGDAGNPPTFTGRGRQG